ncbi:MAG: UvrB/UvrC motif-containing protein, partial [Firmicutes bacterium]|nr:UvrB/UvrC motif-containing protein [Bacillota bacterium]
VRRKERQYGRGIRRAVQRRGHLLREGLDIPEVSLVAILDADKEGFLRSETSLIQTIGRAARNVNGKVIMYADSVTGSMARAIEETDRRRAAQKKYNEENGIVPRSVKKDVRDVISIGGDEEAPKHGKAGRGAASRRKDGTEKKLSPAEREKLIESLTAEMKRAAARLDFELAATIRDRIKELKGN